MSIQIKICGLTDEDGLDAAVDAGVDLIGLVFYAKSPRAVEPDRAAELLDGVPFPDEGGPMRVGLFVDPDNALLDDVTSRVRLDLIQLHGSEPPDRVEEIRQTYGLPVLKAIGVKTRADLDLADAYAQCADGLLLDARPPEDADRPGGNALSFDWSLLTGWVAPLPWMLAGGLTPDTVADALRQTGAQAVDVSSGVESALGIKDPDLIATFVKAVREVDR